MSAQIGPMRAARGSAGEVLAHPSVGMPFVVTILAAAGTKPSLPLLFFGALAVVAGLSPVLFAINIRIYQRKGMTTGGAAWRRGESSHDYQERSKALDKTWAEKARHLRPYGLVLALIGVVVVVVGFAI